MKEVQTRALKCETLGGIFLVHAPFGQSVLCSQHVKTPSLSIENLQRKGPTHNTTVCTCTSFFTCFTCSFSCFAHIIALFALYRSLTGVSMVTLFGVHAFRYWSAPVVSESLPCTPINHDSSHHPGNSE